MKKWIYLALFFTMTVLFACGGGGGAGGPGLPTAAIITLSTEGTLPPGTTIGGVALTINLPAGVTVKTDANGNVDSGVVTASGVAKDQAFVIALYTAATTTEQARLDIVLASTSLGGFGVGEFAKVNCGIAAGSNPQASELSLTNIQVVDNTSFNIISTVTATFSAVIP